MRISIAMATYNGARHLPEQLDSFICQTRQPDELVICDDGSTDATLEILEAFRLQAPFTVRIYRNETNMGYTKNFEKTLSLCEGDIIFLSDQDDVWFNNKIAEMTDIMAMQSNIFVLQANMILTDEKLNPTTFTQLGNILSVGKGPESFITGCGTALRREWLTIALPVPAELKGHDYWIHQLALSLNVRALIEKPLQYYRRHNDNTSNWLASRPRRTTQMDAFMTHGFSSDTVRRRQELEHIRASWLRLNESASALKNIGLLDRQTTAISALSRRIENMNERIQIIEMSRLKRLPRVLAFWMRGGYCHFLGWKSAIKDILRP